MFGENGKYVRMTLIQLKTDTWRGSNAERHYRLKGCSSIGTDIVVQLVLPFMRFVERGGTKVRDGDATTCVHCEQEDQVSSPIFQSVPAQLSLIDRDPAQINFPPAHKCTRACSYTHAGTVCSHVDIDSCRALTLLFASTWSDLCSQDSAALQPRGHIGTKGRVHSTDLSWMHTHIPKHSSFLRPSLEHSSTSSMSGLSKNRLRVNLSLHWGLDTLLWFWFWINKSNI